MTLKTIIKHLVNVADNKKAANIKVFEVSEKVWITDYIMIIGVKNSIHSKSISEAHREIRRHMTWPHFFTQ